MAVNTVRGTVSIGYGPATTARASGVVRDAAFSQSSQISELSGAQLAGTRAEASTPDGFEGLGVQHRLVAQQQAKQAQIPSFSSQGLVPMAFFAQERSDASAQSNNSLARGLGPNAAGKGAGTYESAKRNIEGGPEANYRYS
ncbi:hypothetical protein MTBLM1_60038 [Rhodospirillaceae bacterium LM-1]|nr:hypothetical protein MTBLM1_60038 [Rhodospirillaceae bacterium LM-1]